jgi:hypothetical protein
MIFKNPRQKIAHLIELQGSLLTVIIQAEEGAKLGDYLNCRGAKGGRLASIEKTGGR